MMVVSYSFLMSTVFDECEHTIFIYPELPAPILCAFLPLDLDQVKHNNFIGIVSSKRLSTGSCYT
jgi:hypothetical protein